MVGQILILKGQIIFENIVKILLSLKIIWCDYRKMMVNFYFYSKKNVFGCP